MRWLIRELLLHILFCSYIHGPTVLLLLFPSSNSESSSVMRLLLFRTALLKSRASDCFIFHILSARPPSASRGPVLLP